MTNVISIDKSKRPSINTTEKFNWLVWTKELPTECVVKASNPWQAMNEVEKLHTFIKTFTCVIPEDDSIEWLPEWDIPSDGWGLSGEVVS